MKYEQFLANAAGALSDCREMKASLSAVQAALSAVPDMVRKNQRLEKESAELKAEVARLKAWQDDGCIPLPLDADGVPIRIGDEMDIDGEIAVVKGYQVSYVGDELQFIAVTEGYRKTFTLFGKNHKHLKHGAMPSDSWESWKRTRA